MMPALVSLTGRVLLQVGDNDPIEVGTIEIPIHATVRPEPEYRRPLHNAGEA